jgi:hypothetical protein
VFLSQDVLKFGFSSREYVVLNERSMNSEVDNLGESAGSDSEATTPEETTTEA